MKSLLKKTLFLIVAACATSNKSKAQTSTAVCRINYYYDASGNRIKRDYSCPSNNPWDNAPWGENTIFTSIYPNPTTGVVTGVFSATIGGEAGSAYITVSTMGGISIFQQEYTQPTSSVTIDLTQQIPGQYLLSVFAFNKLESYIITKL